MPGSAGEAAGGRRAATAGSFAIGRPAGSSLSAAAGALFAALAALLVLYPGALSGPFFSDDYILLDKVRDASLGAILAPRALAYGYWRPWSRELHFAALERAFGARPLPFHVVSVALAAAALALFFTLARRLRGSLGARPRPPRVPGTSTHHATIATTATSAPCNPLAKTRKRSDRSRWSADRATGKRHDSSVTVPQR